MKGIPYKGHCTGDCNIGDTLQVKEGRRQYDGRLDIAAALLVIVW